MRRALVVSNDKQAQQIKAMLEPHNIQTLCLTSWSSALSILEEDGDNSQDAANFIVYDVRSHMDVKSFRNTARNIQPDILVFAFGPKRPERGPARSSAKVDSHGADYYLNSPFTEGELMAVVEQMVPESAAA